MSCDGSCPHDKMHVAESIVQSCGDDSWIHHPDCEEVDIDAMSRLLLTAVRDHRRIL
jgi:hypothetical protein